MEGWGWRPEYPTCTVHGHGGSEYRTVLIDSYTQFVKFEAEWLADNTVQAYMNGNPIGTPMNVTIRNWTTTMYPIIALQVHSGSNWAVAGPADPGVDEMSMTVESMRVWQRL